MKIYYRVKKAKKWYKVYVGITGRTYQSGLTYYKAKKLANELNSLIQ